MTHVESELSRLRLGVPYYFEQWPRERWETDARLMADAGVTLVRMAEFAWSVLEPSPGKHDFNGLDDAMGLFASHGISTILCTPSPTYPPWLHALHPDIHQVRSNGQPKEYGMRQDACKNHPGYRRAVMDLVQLMAARYGRDERVAAWQIDNELGCHGTTRCFCPRCESAFRAWLAAHFHNDIDGLNAAWGTAFWSQRYGAFSEVSVPREPADRMGKHGQNPGLLLDFARFSSDTNVLFLAEQASIIRKESPRAVITHNLMKGHFDIDYLRLARELDVVSWDNYPFFELQGEDRAPSAFPHAFMRGLKGRNVWVMEQAAGPGGWDFVQPTAGARAHARVVLPGGVAGRRHGLFFPMALRPVRDRTILARHPAAQRPAGTPLRGAETDRDGDARPGRGPPGDDTRLPGGNPFRP